MASRLLVADDSTTIQKIISMAFENEDVEVHTYNGAEISLKGAGGPTCLTRPFLRYDQ